MGFAVLFRSWFAPDPEDLGLWSAEQHELLQSTSLQGWVSWRIYFGKGMEMKVEKERDVCEGMDALEVFRQFLFREAAFSWRSPSSLPSQNKSQMEGSRRQLAVGEDAAASPEVKRGETNERESLCYAAAPLPLPWQPFSKPSATPGQGD